MVTKKLVNFCELFLDVSELFISFVYQRNSAALTLEILSLFYISAMLFLIRVRLRISCEIEDSFHRRLSKRTYQCANTSFFC